MVFAGRNFIVGAMDRSLKELHEAQDGCLIAYFSPTGWQHIGGLRNPHGEVEPAFAADSTFRCPSSLSDLNDNPLILLNLRF